VLLQGIFRIKLDQLPPSSSQPWQGYVASSKIRSCASKHQWHDQSPTADAVHRKICAHSSPQSVIAALRQALKKDSQSPRGDSRLCEFALVLCIATKDYIIRQLELKIFVFDDYSQCFSPSLDRSLLWHLSFHRIAPDFRIIKTAESNPQRTLPLPTGAKKCPNTLQVQLKT